MTVKSLIELLKQAPADMKVYVSVTTPSDMGFLFQEACEGETGVVTLGDIENDEDAATVFAVLPHGFTDEEEGHQPDHLQN